MSLRGYAFTFLSGVAMFFSVDLVDRWMAAHGLHAASTWIDNLLLGIVASAIVFFLQRQQEAELRRQRQSAEIIEQMNHHIRNALQVIIARSALSKNEPETRQIEDAVARIEWALREILPGDGPSGARNSPSPSISEDPRAEE
jgi:hypothetical protein